MTSPRPLSGEPYLRVLDYTAASPAEDLALDEAIQRGLEADTSPPTWRLWEARTHAVVLGTGQEHALEVHLEAARAAGIPVLRRHSGGGAVLIGPGALNYSGCFYFDRLPGSQTIAGAMEAALRPVLDALGLLGVHAHLAGLSDLAAPGAGGALRKLAGNSQARKRRSVLVHGTLLAAPDWALMDRVLKHPSREPDYRAGRGHRAFLTSLQDLGAPISLAALSASLRRILGQIDSESTEPLPSELATAAHLLGEKYGQDDWNLRR